MSKKHIILLTVLTIFTILNCSINFAAIYTIDENQEKITQLFDAGYIMAETYGDAIIYLQNTVDLYHP